MKTLATIIIVAINIVVLAFMTLIGADEIAFYLYGAISGATNTWLLYEIDNAQREEDSCS